MNKFLAVIFLLCLLAALAFSMVSCTYSINMVHTQGTASDVVDENQSAEPDIKTDISIPGTTL